MSIFFRREFYSKAVSLLLSLAFLAESTLAPILLFLPQTASAAGSWGISIDSGKAGTFPNPVIRGKQVDFVATLTVTSPPSPLNFRLEASKDLTLRHYYIQRAGGEETALGDPTRPAATLVNRSAYVWDFYNLTTGTYTLRFNFDVPLSTTDASAQFDILMQGLSNGYGSGYQDASFSVPVGSFTSDVTGGAHVSQGSPLAISFASAAPSAPVYVNCIDPNGVMCADNLADGTTNASGQWSKNYDTSGWTLGTYRGWIVVNGLKSNLFVFTVTVPATTAQTIVISRTPATSPTVPFKVGDATVSIVNASLSFFTSNLTGTGYNQIGSNAPRTFSFTTADLVSSGACNATTGICNIPGNWDTTSLLCPTGVTGTQQMTEWYTIGNVTSNKLNWYFQCSGTTPTTNAQNPVGSLDGIDGSGNASGWAVDPDSSSTSISVHFYIDGAAGQGGTYAGSAVATLANASANGSGYSGSHGYTFSIPSQWRDGKQHTLYVHGIDLSGDGSKNVLLSNVPKSFTLGTSASNNPSLSVSPTSFVAGSSATISVANAASNATVKVFCRDPNNVVCDDSAIYTTDVSGRFTHTYDTTGWTVGAYQGWVTTNDVQSNTLSFTVTAPATTAQTIVISRTPATSATNPFKVGDATVSSSANSPSLFTNNLTGTGYNQIGSNAPRTFSFTTADLVSSSACNATTGICNMPGNWDASSLTCPAGVTGTQQMTEWYTVGDIISNKITWYFECSGSTTTPPPGDRPAPTPTTAPMATLTLERDQEQVTPGQPISFSGVLDASKVSFPQGSSLVMAISDGVAVDRIEIDGSALASSAFSVNSGSIKIPFSAALYNGSHTFRLVLRNALSVQLDRRVSVWVTAVDAGNTLLLKGRTASTLVAHLPTEVIGQGTSIAIGTGYYDDNTFRTFRYLQSAQEIDVTRGPFFTPTTVPPLPDNIAFTLFPGDASMQRIAFTIKSFSEPLAREFITAQYQYLLGRDPSNEEVSHYLPKFTQWRNSLGALTDVYNRRADVREYVRVPEKVIKDWRGKYVSNLPSYDKLIEWATTQGWKEEPTLQSFKMQTGYDDAWKLFDELWTKWAPLAAGSSTGWSESTTPSSFALERDSFNSIHELCGGAGPYGVGDVGKPDFAACWKDPLKRHQLILWAKDIGWAYNKVVQDWSVTSTVVEGMDYVQTGRNIVEINPSGPILASTFGPGKYPEYAAEQQMRYPPAQLYYDLVSSPEYAAFPEQRFRKNIDSIFRLFYSRPATESDIAWTKNTFIRGGGTNYDRYDQGWSWINPQWEPNGQLIASNYDYIDDVEFLKNPRYITDDIYGIRNIPGEIDAVASRLIEAMDKVKYQRPELYNGNNFKRIVVGLYRLYLRRNPTDAEIEGLRTSGKDFGDIELKLNQSSEYGKNLASPEAVRNLYRNYLGRDPSDAELASGTSRSISSITNGDTKGIGTSVEMKTLAQAHRENVYIFPVKRIKIVKCGFFCSVLGKALGMGLQAIPGVGFAYSATAMISCGQCINPVNIASNIVLNSTSEGFEQAGFDGETFVENMSAARAIAGQAGGVYNIANLMENADPTILDGFRTMAVAPQTPQGNAFSGLASPLAAVAGLFGANRNASSGRLAQIDVSSHYGSGGAAQVSGATPAKGKSNAKSSVGVAKVVTPVSFTKTLVQGSRGAEVLKLQKVLGGADLTFLPEYRTGYYGAKTVAAVKRFQKRYGLKQSGLVDSKTRALLNSYAR